MNNKKVISLIGKIHCGIREELWIFADGTSRYYKGDAKHNIHEPEKGRMAS